MELLEIRWQYFFTILTGGIEEVELTIPVSDAEDEEEDEEDGLPKVENLYGVIISFSFRFVLISKRHFLM